MEEKKEILVLPFGRKIQVGNYTVLKYTKTLTKQQLKSIREDKDIHPEVRRQLTRAGLPYIKVEAISMIWSVEFCCNTGVFMHIDRVLPLALLAAQEGREPEYESIADFAHLFGMWMTDTCAQGDSIYYADKGKALQAYLERQAALKSAQETPEEKAEDDKILEEVKAEEEAKANIIDMAQNINKEGGSDEGN